MDLTHSSCLRRLLAPGSTRITVTNQLTETNERFKSDSNRGTVASSLQTNIHQSPKESQTVVCTDAATCAHIHSNVGFESSNSKPNFTQTGDEHVIIDSAIYPSSSSLEKDKGNGVPVVKPVNLQLPIKKEAADLDLIDSAFSVPGTSESIIQEMSAPLLGHSNSEDDDRLLEAVKVENSSSSADDGNITDETQSCSFAIGLSFPTPVALFPHQAASDCRDMPADNAAAFDETMELENTSVLATSALNHCEVAADSNAYLSSPERKKKLKCSFCDFKAAYRSHIARHMKTHTGDTPLECCFCEFKCTTQSDLVRHNKTHTGGKPYVCSVCCYGCSSRYLLDVHMRTHTGEKPFKCLYCDYKASRKDVLAIHTRRHTGQTPYWCSLCDKGFNNQSGLRLHISHHTDEKPFGCALCTYTSAVRRNVILHMRTHTGEKPFTCSHCGYKFSKKCALVRHTRTHTGEKPYHCTVCDYKSADSGGLAVHMRTHTAEKPYKCSLCDYKSTNKRGLNVHMRQHSDVMPYWCLLCDYKAKQKGNLSAHMKKHHSVDQLSRNTHINYGIEDGTMYTHAQEHGDTKDTQMNDYTALDTQTTMSSDD